MIRTFFNRAILVAAFPIAAVTIGALCLFWGQPADFPRILREVFNETWDEAGRTS